MKKHDVVFMVGLIVLSAVSSFLFTFYGLTTIMSGGATKQSTVFAYVTVAYGLGNLAILSLAWSSREKWATTVNMLMALCFLGVFIMDMFISNVQGGVEFVGLLLLVVVLYANWFAVKAVIARE